MPGAGFYSIHTDKLTFGRDGRWYADGEPVLHPKLASFFSRHLRRKAEGGYEIWVDERFHSDVEVEDTPFVVVTVDFEADGAVMLELSDGTHEPLTGEGLTIAPDHSLHCPIKEGRERARFLRPAQNHLASHFEEHGGAIVLRVGPCHYPIASE